MRELDNPVWEALVGPQAALAIRSRRAARYPADVSPLAGVAAPDAAALRDLGELFEPGDIAVLLAGEEAVAGSGWKSLDGVELIQMLCEEPVSPPQKSPTLLSSSDVDDMLALVEATRPGPFGARTLEMGRYVGFREGGRLVAMGGERLRPAGYTELSGICTAPAVRGRGLAEAVVRALASQIQDRGELPFLHVMAGSPSEAGAIALYTRLGFRERRRVPAAILQRDE